MTGNQTADRIDQIRAFNRFYTRHIGILDEGFLGQQYSLPEIRVLFEVAGDSSTTPHHWPIICAWTQAT
ncbi:hypothetical protein [Sedimenticola selenatireducens]|uniref:hypothetical protein n=1 Tax=Sedimenticola selenatireducens TaxID=191960 RepID=UPI00235500C2|nr:hypothetical protein [Sedimenticola selenatireducens]